MVDTTKAVMVFAAKKYQILTTVSMKEMEAIGAWAGGKNRMDTPLLAHVAWPVIARVANLAALRGDFSVDQQVLLVCSAVVCELRGLFPNELGKKPVSYILDQTIQGFEIFGSLAGAWIHSPEVRKPI